MVLMSFIIRTDWQDIWMAENKENKEKLFLNTQDGNNNNKKTGKH